MGWTQEHVNAAESELRSAADAQPDPRIALIGFTGVGKSSTINALFNAGLPIGNVRACTQEAAALKVDVSEYVGANGSVIVYDMPGLGEDRFADERHPATYLRVLPSVDVAVWTFHAGDRAMTPMQDALLTLQHRIGPSFIQRLLFAVNKADAIAPGEMDWNTVMNLPSKLQRKNLDDFEAYIREKVQQVAPQWQGEIISYSARRAYRLDQLMTAMVEAAAPARHWVLDDRAAVADFRKYVDPQVLQWVESNEKQVVESERRPWRGENT